MTFSRKKSHDGLIKYNPHKKKQCCICHSSCNPTFDHNVDCNGSWRCLCFHSLNAQPNDHRRWINETKGFISLCLWRFLVPVFNLRLTRQPMEEKEEDELPFGVNLSQLTVLTTRYPRFTFTVSTMAQWKSGRTILFCNNPVKENGQSR